MAKPSDAQNYAKIRYQLMVADLAVSWTALGFLQFSGLSHRLAGWARQTAGSEPLALALYLAVLGVALYAIDLPLHFYRSHSLEHRFGLSRLTFGGWLMREAKRTALGGAMSLLLFEGLYLLLRQAPQTWWLWATAGWILLSIVLTRILPTVIIPIFYKSTRLDNRDLEERLLRMCKRVGILTVGIFRLSLGAETRKANAAVVGLGKTRRVLVSDTLLENFPPDEIEGVLAHELAHHRFRHLSKGIALAAVGSLALFWLTNQALFFWVEPLGLANLADFAGLPMLLLWLSVVNFVCQPIQNGISRAFEWEADRFATSMSISPGVFASALRRLGDLNLADPNPPRWIEWIFYDHPSIGRRVRAADRAAGGEVVPRLAGGAAEQAAGS